MHARHALSPLALATALAAQHAVVPDVWATTDAPGAIGIAWSQSGQRQQFLIDGVHTAPFAGRTLVGLEFRRNPGRAYPAGQLALTVRIGAAAMPAAQASDDFDRNLPNATQVFSGTVSLLASAATATPTWDGSDTLRIAFANGWTCPAGNLCIDIAGQPVGSSAFWAFDAANEAMSGSVASVGNACGPIAALAGDTAFTNAHRLLPGATVEFANLGPQHSTSFLLFGVQFLGTPIDLALLGSPGCLLRVDGFAAVAASHGPDLFAVPEPLGAAAFVTAQVPARSNLLGARFVVQWLSLAIPATVSNALECTVSPALPSLGLATVTRIGTSPAVVDVATGPVLRVLLQ